MRAARLARVKITAKAHGMRVRMDVEIRGPVARQPMANNLADDLQNWIGHLLAAQHQDWAITDVVADKYRRG